METIDAPSFGTSKKKKSNEPTLASILTPLGPQVKKILLEFHKKNPNTQVQSFLKVPKQWISLSDLDKLHRYIFRNKSVNHRTIQKDEIVVDVDSENKAYGRIHLAALEQIWNQFNYKREQWDSGGDGYHSHFTFKQLQAIADEDISEVKKEIIKHLCGNLMYMYKHIPTGQYLFYTKKKKSTTLEKEELEECSHICLVDKKLIQIEWAPHRKGKQKLPFISDLGFVTSGVIEGITPRIPKVVKDFVETNKTKRKAEYALRKWSNEQFSTSKYPACIRFYLGETINGKTFSDERDGTKRAMFHLISFFKHTKNDEELILFINEWLHKISLGQGAVDSHGKELSPWLIKMHIKSNKGLVGCKARVELLEELGCDDICNGCPHKR